MTWGSDTTTPRTLPELRADVALLQGVAEQLERDLVAAQEAEDAYREAYRAQGSEIAAILGRYRLRYVEDASRGEVMVVGNAPDAVLAQVRALVGQRRALENERDAWIRANSVQALTADGWPVVKSLTPSSVAERLKLCRATRDRIAHQLAEREAQLSPGELLASGKPADEYTAYVNEVAALRARLKALEG